MNRRRRWRFGFCTLDRLEVRGSHRKYIIFNILRVGTWSRNTYGSSSLASLTPTPTAASISLYHHYQQQQHGRSCPLSFDTTQGNSRTILTPFSFPSPNINYFTHTSLRTRPISNSLSQPSTAHHHHQQPFQPLTRPRVSIKGIGGIFPLVSLVRLNAGFVAEFMVAHRGAERYFPVSLLVVGKFIQLRN